MCRTGNSLQDNGLFSIPGNGARKPKLAFVFINPTHANISSHPSWKGPRYPFCGVRRLWEVFSSAGIVDRQKIPRKWDERNAEIFLSHIRERRIYLTNLVKRTERHGESPSWSAVKESLPCLLRELREVRAKRVVAMGVLPTRALAGIHVRMSDEFRKVLQGELPSYPASDLIIHPCYFPVGRGNPKRAAAMLRAYAEAFL